MVSRRILATVEVVICEACSWNSTVAGSGRIVV
jgi:hypothetical protein